MLLLNSFDHRHTFPLRGCETGDESPRFNGCEWKVCSAFPARDASPGLALNPFGVKHIKLMFVCLKGTRCPIQG